MRTKRRAGHLGGHKAPESTGRGETSTSRKKKVSKKGV